MLLIVLALFWLALLAPVVIRKIREGAPEKSIQSFHAEHEVLSRQDYTVIPAHRLEEPDGAPLREPVVERRPRLTVVHPDDTFGTLASRTSWKEWSEDYEYDDAPPARTPTNHYAAAYSSRPREEDVTVAYEPPIRRRSMRAQRRVVFSRLVACASVLTLAAFFISYSPLVDLAALAWFSVVLYVALALYAVSQGYLSDASLIRRSSRRLATVEPLFEPDDRYAVFEDEPGEEFYEPDAIASWQRQPERYRALG